MSNAGGVRFPENLVLGAALSSLSFFGTAVVSAMVKATEAMTSAGVILLFQNLICFLLVLPFAVRGGWPPAEDADLASRFSVPASLPAPRTGGRAESR